MTPWAGGLDVSLGCECLHGLPAKVAKGRAEGECYDTQTTDKEEVFHFMHNIQIVNDVTYTKRIHNINVEMPTSPLPPPHDELG